jgi:tetratricopeptide (TPR) repeat protein
VLDLLTAMVDKSLVVADEQEGVARYRLLETIREYARERLVQSGEATAVQQRHAAHYHALATATTRAILTATARGPEGFDRLEQEHDNHRAALRWLTEQGEAEQALQLGTALTALWGIRGYLTEGRDSLARLLALPEAQASADTRAAALGAAGRLAFNQGDYAAAHRVWERSLALWRGIGETGRAAAMLNNLGHLARERGDYASARALLTESLELSRAAGGRAVGATLSYLGLVALQEGDYATARTLFEEALGIHQEAQAEYGIVLASTRLGHVAHAEGDLAQARARYEQSLAAQRRSGDKRAVATLLTNLGMVDVDVGQVALARSRFEESAALVRHLRDLAGTAMLLDGLAGLAAIRAQSGRALRLAGAAAALREALGKSHPHNVRDWLERKLAPARASLGTEAAAAAWAEGHAMDPERALADALDAAAPGASD